MDQETYDTERQYSIEAEHKDAEHYDKWLITIASGALGLSIVFIRDIAPDPAPETRVWLVTSWIAFLLSITLTMFSLLASQKGLQRYRDILDNKRYSEILVSQKNRWAELTSALNWLSLMMFVGGAICLMVYSHLNL